MAALKMLASWIASTPVSAGEILSPDEHAR
jgi:hypothetical protein